MEEVFDLIRIVDHAVLARIGIRHRRELSGRFQSMLYKTTEAAFEKADIVASGYLRGDRANLLPRLEFAFVWQAFRVSLLYLYPLKRLIGGLL